MPDRGTGAGEGRGWRGDVGDGVAAWLGAAQPAGQTAPTGPPAPPPDDPEATGPGADTESVARTILLDQLTGRARSRHELADKLASKQVPDEVAHRLLDRFEEVGLVDDEAFARTWVAQRGEGKGLARRALAQELRRKGIEETVARGVLDEVDPDDEREAARRLVRGRLRSVQRLDHTRATRRLVGMLARKGHDASVAWAVVREELGGGAGDDEES